MRIYLVGYMYSGKSTVGRALAKLFGYDFIDLDQAIEERCRTTISILFERYGEAMFRQVETQVLHSTANYDNVVISTGGGTPCFNDNMEWILQHGTPIYLRLSTDEIFQRMLASRKRRPVMALIDPDERKRFIDEQLAEREGYYEQASLIIDSRGDLPDVVAKRIHDAATMALSATPPLQHVVE